MLFYRHWDLIPDLKILLILFLGRTTVHPLIVATTTTTMAEKLAIKIKMGLRYSQIVLYRP